MYGHVETEDLQHIRLLQRRFIVYKPSKVAPIDKAAQESGQACPSQSPTSLTMHISQDGLLLLQRHELDELYINTVLLLHAGNASMQVAKKRFCPSVPHPDMPISTRPGHWPTTNCELLVVFFGFSPI